MRAPARALAREGGTRGESPETAVPPCSVRASLSLPPRALRQGRAGRRVEPPHPAGRTAGARSAPRAHACVRGSQPARHGERSGALRCAALRCAQPPQQRRRERRLPCPSSVATSPRAVAPPRGRRAACAVCTHKQPASVATCQAAENAKSHGYRLRRGAALPSNPRARWVTEGRQRPLPLKPWVKTFLPDGSSFPSLRIFCSLG